MKIRCISFSVYLAINRAAKEAFEIGVEWPNNTGGSKSLLKSSNRGINLKKIESVDLIQS